MEDFDDKSTPASTTTDLLPAPLHPLSDISARQNNILSQDVSSTLGANPLQHGYNIDTASSAAPSSTRSRSAVSQQCQNSYQVLSPSVRQPGHSSADSKQCQDSCQVAPLSIRLPVNPSVVSSSLHSPSAVSQQNQNSYPLASSSLRSPQLSSTSLQPNQNSYQAACTSQSQNLNQTPSVSSDDIFPTYLPASLPFPISTRNLQKQQTNSPLTTSVPKVERFPANNYIIPNLNKSFKDLWSNTRKEDGFHLQEVVNPSEEFNFVQMMIVDTLPVTEILISRLENSLLWNAYQKKKDKMIHVYEYDLETVNEQYMFHGDTKAVCDSLITERFNWRLRGSMRTEGSYYANNARLASSMAVPDEENYKRILVSLVMVGHATRGKAGAKELPCHTKTKIRFDTIVDNKSCPSVFVKFNINEHYPAYLIKFKV